ncbi:Zn(2)-C6 fungal-type DNA-binding domain protein [Akanthomyces lecanii RCEF 1005]|uniref:Zn(2)-C6 fungal-type DNA-binding domain protein n=1 Tax=Akanthomyces lecanii RCEF 1005 TaxID=1081108 RepID=A0A162KI05_CORDF|nr:Zn(2)-C6 fungal-type DNA-binding domain protein [Akanthomyces lecanii RCEF 1005]
MSSCPVSSSQDSGPAAGRKRIPTACEACRVAKIRCLPSDQDGTCQKCLVSKKECVSRTGPRRRRPNKSKLPPGDSLPPPPKPTGTFTIDIPLAQASGSSSVETLRETHAAYLDSLFPPSHTSAPPSPSYFHGSISSEAASSPSATSCSIQDMHARPSFNISSAESLLDTFRSMLYYCPCILLPEDVTVRDLAQTRPFVLLAILAAAAGAKSLQGHNLYDDEFRKVFALKLVAGGERSLELLQGILIYCLWYPFHLRPRAKQIFQYTRMAADLVHDLELDTDPFPDTTTTTMTPERLDSIRAYVAQYYLSSSFAVTWQAHRSHPVPFTSWTSQCCHLLTTHASSPGDAVLASLARLGHTVRDAWAAVRDHNPAENSTLVFRGLEAQFQDQQAHLPASVSNTLPVRLQSFFTEFFLLGGSILRMPAPASKPPSPPPPAPDPFRPTLSRLTSCVHAVAQFLALVAAIPSASLAHLSTGDWGRLILGIVVAMRLSFPLPPECCCPEYDSAWARSQLGFAAFLDVMTADAAGTDLTSAAKRFDVVSASKVVIAVVKEKYEKRLALLLQKQDQQQQQQQQQVEEQARSKCPMLDGSLDRYFPLWDGSVGQTMSMPSMSFMEGVADGSDAMLDAWAEDAFDWIDPGQGML